MPRSTATAAASPPSNGRPSGGRQYQRKTEEILQAAEEAFLRHGFTGVSVDAIADLAGVSKKTVYNNFGNKDALYAEVVARRCDGVVPTAFPPVGDDAEMEEALVANALSFLERLYAPEQVALYQTVVADARQFPEFGKMMFEGPISRSQKAFDQFFREQAEAGRLAFPDIDLAAPHFIGMLKTNLHMKLFLNQTSNVTPERLERIVRSCVRLFLRGAAPRAA